MRQLLPNLFQHLKHAMIGPGLVGVHAFACFLIEKENTQKPMTICCLKFSGYLKPLTCSLTLALM